MLSFNWLTGRPRSLAVQWRSPLATSSASPASARAKRSPPISSCRSCPNEFHVDPPSAVEIAAGLGLEPADIGFDGHRPSLYSAGAPFLFVPVRSLDAIGRAAPGVMPWATKEGPATFLYTRDTEREGSAYHARVFAGAWGVGEDPATGSAAAAFAGVVQDFDRPRDGEHMLIIEQGFEMGRPSLIALGLVIEAGALAAATIGGSVVLIANGSLDL